MLGPERLLYHDLASSQARHLFPSSLAYKQGEPTPCYPLPQIYITESFTYDLHLNSRPPNCMMTTLSVHFWGGRSRRLHESHLNRVVDKNTTSITVEYFAPKTHDLELHPDNASFRRHSTTVTTHCRIPQTLKN